MPGIDYHALRQQITMREVLDLLGFQPTSRRGAQLRGACPIPGCPSTSHRSFSVHLDRQVYQCFGCHRRGNVLDLWAAARSLNTYQAAVDLCRILNVDPPWLPASHLIPIQRRSKPVPSRAPSRNR